MLGMVSGRGAVWWITGLVALTLSRVHSFDAMLDVYLLVDYIACLFPSLWQAGL